VEEDEEKSFLTQWILQMRMKVMMERMLKQVRITTIFL
jgi:hypothetical protein